MVNERVVATFCQLPEAPAFHLGRIRGSAYHQRLDQGIQGRDRCSNNHSVELCAIWPSAWCSRRRWSARVSRSLFP